MYLPTLLHPGLLMPEVLLQVICLLSWKLVQFLFLYREGNNGRLTCQVGGTNAYIWVVLWRCMTYQNAL